MSEEYWNGKAVVVTGASSGIGAALVRHLAPFRPRFCLLSRRMAPMEALARELMGTGAEFFIRSCDVRDRRRVEDVVDEFQGVAGRIDVVWVNAGIGGETSFRRWQWPVVEGMLQTNLMGALHTVFACLRHMQRQAHGVIVGVSSASAMGGLPNRAIYGASKVALAYVLDALAAELPHLQFTNLYPGFVDTPLNAGNPLRIFLLQPADAARRMVRAVEKGKVAYVFPWRMRLLFRVARALPSGLFRRVARRFAHISRPPRTTQ